MDTPFFSILLPTKNRAGVLPYAIRSLYEQSFRDFEVIVADNDDTTATAEIHYAGLAPLLDPRFRYLRTGGLWMSENWETALALARGAYVYVLEDKAVLHPDALQVLAEAIRFYNPRCLVFDGRLHAAPVMRSPQDALEAAVPGFPALPEGRAPVRQVSSARIIDRFLEQGWGPLHDDGPRSINSVCERSLIQQIQETTGGGRFYLPFAPDVTSCLLQLDLLESVARLDRELVSFAVHEQLSLGNRFRLKLRYGFEVMFSAGQANLSHFQRMPLGYCGVVHNHLFAEFLQVRDRARGRLRDKRLSLDHYFERVEQDLDELERAGERVGPLRSWVRATRDRLGPGTL